MEQKITEILARLGEFESAEMIDAEAYVYLMNALECLRAESERGNR